MSAFLDLLIFGEAGIGEHGIFRLELTCTYYYLLYHDKVTSNHNT